MEEYETDEHTPLLGAPFNVGLRRLLSRDEELCTRGKLRDLFFLFPGGVENVWMNRDRSSLAEKIDCRDAIRPKLEEAETLLIKATQRAWRKAGKLVLKPDDVLEVTASGYEMSQSASGCRVPQVPCLDRMDSVKQGKVSPRESSDSSGGGGGGTCCENHDKVWLWREILSRDNRPSHRLLLSGVSWLPGIAPFSKRVDTVDRRRDLLNALNLEIKLLQNSQKVALRSWIRHSSNLILR
ncbi:hypothetical protein FDECE_13041 [Fusarium decemcellulare]|nr:hypothetical protein FDECE_13041 [Fusarium decemcellulare]